MMQLTRMKELTSLYLIHVRYLDNMLDFQGMMLKYCLILWDTINPAKTEDESPLFNLVNGFILLAHLHTKISIRAGNYQNKASHMLVKRALYCWFHDWTDSCLSHFSATCLHCREWNQHVRSVKWCHSKSSCVTNISNISTKPTPLYSPPTPPSSKRNCIFLSLLLTDVARLTMSFIPQLMQTAPAEKYMT